MSLQTLGLLASSTVAASGGTALPLTSVGGSENKNRLVVDEDTDLRTQRSIDFSVRRPHVQGTAPNGYTQARSICAFKVPLSLANGNTTVNTVAITMSTDVETTVAEKAELRSLAAQLLIDVELDAFWDMLNPG